MEPEPGVQSSRPRICPHSEGTRSRVMSCPAHPLQRNEGPEPDKKVLREKRATANAAPTTTASPRVPLYRGGGPSGSFQTLPSLPHSHTPSSQVQQTQALGQIPGGEHQPPSPRSPLRQGHKHGERGVKGHLGPWRFLGALRPPRPPACRAQSGSFLRALGWKHKGKNRNQLLATSANFPLRNLPAQLTIGPHRGDSIRRRRQAVLPRLEPLCFQTQLPPTSRGGPGGRQPPPSPSVSPESQTLASPGTSMEGAGERMPASTSAHGTARAVPGKQCGAHSAAPEPAQDGSPDVTARLSLSPPGPNRRASRGRRLGQRSRGRAAWAGPGQRREQCGHREGTRTSRHPPLPRAEVFPENKAGGESRRGRAQPS